ncbi:MAG: hypothetical protein K2K94_02645 [Muribaculaceae bacterium]|nr:hypothetical protein [Muribaculaceae bacterium]
MKKLSKIFCFLLLLFITLPIYGKDIKDMYVQRTGAEGSLFFIFKQDLPALKNTEKIAKKISYDYTYLEQTDSVAMLMTLHLPVVIKNIEMTVAYNNSHYSDAAELIYVAAKGNKFEYRLRFMMPFHVFEKMYATDTPFVIKIQGNSDGKESAYEFGYNSKKWINARKNLSTIINIIRLNTHKE